MPEKMFWSIVLCLFACFASMKAIGQLPVKKLGVEQGLSNETIRSIYQDRKGFMWFGTLDGLCRFDGYNFKVYHNRFKDTSSLLSNVIYGITEDNAGNLWLATRLGVCRLNKFTDNFSTVYYKRATDGKSVRLDREVIKTVWCDFENNILIASELQGLMMCPGASTQAIQVPYQGKNNSFEYKYGVQSICADGKGRTLVFVQGKGLCELNYKQKQLQLLNGSVTYVNSMLVDGDSLWLATNSGVFSYNTRTNKVKLVFSVANAALSSNLAIALSSDRRGKLYIGTMGGGLSIFDKHSGKISQVQSGDGRSDLSSSGIYALFNDQASRVWVGTRRGGINILDDERQQFSLVSHEPGNSNSLSGNFITSVCEMPNGNLLVATEENGINMLDAKTQKITRYRYDPNNEYSIPSDNVNNILLDHSGKIWLATYTNGICSFDPLKNAAKRYETKNPKSGVENSVFNTLFEDRSQTLWASALRRGNHFGALYQYNRAQDKFEVFDDRLSDLFSLAEDSDGNLWGGGITELVKIDKDGRKHQFFYIGQFIRTITEDGKGHLWLGTEGGGLVLFDRRTQKIISRYTTSQGLSNNSIFSTLKDDSNNLWLGTFNGLSRFDIKTKTFKNYYRNDGLESDQFHFNAAARLRSGAFIFGGIKGYNIFYPGKIGISSIIAPLHFTGILVDGTPLESVPEYVKEFDSSEVKLIEVPYANAVFSFKFAALEYAVPNKIRYAYKMEGWDKGWNYTGNINGATYTHLSEGSYVFKVKSTDRNGVWRNEISMLVNVLPPWYRSWWAWLFYCSFVASLFYLYIRYRSRQAHLIYEVNLQKVNLQKEKVEKEMAAAELAREKAEHEKDAAELETERTQRALEQSERETEKAIAEREREVNERRASFFTNISHEFRSPLALIINPVKDILEKADLLPETEERKMEIVYRNARRMLSLTNQLLSFRREESGLDAIRPVKTDIVALCREVYLCFVQQAEARQVQYDFQSNKDQIEVYADPEKLEIVFYNLLSNALKYTPDSGCVIFKIHEKKESIEVEVSDNGPGIAAEDEKNIFDKFYQSKAVSTKPGFGIGLYLARQFAEAHSGTIQNFDRPGGGAIFTVGLLKGFAHFSPGQLSLGRTEGLSYIKEVSEEGTDLRPNPANAVTQVQEDTSRLVANERQVVLIIDDDAAIREYLELIFSSNYQVYSAVSAELGIAQAEKLLPDIIVSDVMMTGLTGIDLCKSVKTNPMLSHIPVILLTGASNDTLRLWGVQEGADDYILKPFDKTFLLARVANLLQNRNSLQRYFYNEITLSKQDSKISEEYRRFLENCIEIVEAHLDEEKFNGKILAKALGMSYSSITKKIKAISGQSLNSFIRFVRLRKAARLFIDTDYNVTEVAGLVGIFDARYFREQFSSQFNMNPSEFIKKFRKPFANRFTVNKDALGGNKDNS